MGKLVLVIILLLIIGDCIGQNTNSLLNKTDVLYNQAKISAQSGDKDKSIEQLNQVLKYDPKYFMAFFGLADIYHETGEHKLEEEALINGLKISYEQYPPGYLFLAELLYSEARYAEARRNIEHYVVLKKTITIEENRLLKSCRFAVTSIESPVPFHPEDVGKAINTADDEYWPSLNGEANTLVFTRLVRSEKDVKNIELAQEDFYVSRYDSTVWQKATPLGAPINTEENEGAQCISADGRLLFFTGCNREDGLGSCDIYMSVRQKGKWSEPVNLGNPVNSVAWESQPSVSADGRWLYFTSNRKGGKGKMDVWKAERLGVSPEGYPVYGKVINLESVNTLGNEFSPFIHADGETLYFASDFWPGMGGKDLFFILADSLKTSIPQNLGYPVNTSGDEDGLVVEVSGERAWFTANKSGLGGRDIFTFMLPEQLKPRPVSWVKGTIVNRKTGQLISPDIVLNNLITNKSIQHFYPFENDGEFLFCLPSGHNYGLNISKEGFLFHSENFNLLETFNRHQPMKLNIALDPIEKGQITILKNIFFETDSFRLKPESQGQLREMTDFMTKNPGLVIEIGGHTDSQGSEDYNLILSGKRADAVVSSLINLGVSPSRIKSKGYGFSIPLADNSSEEGRSQNRRTEFKIL